MGGPQVKVVDVLLGLLFIQRLQIVPAAGAGLVFKLVVGAEVGIPVLVHVVEDEPQGGEPLLPIDQLPVAVFALLDHDGLQAVVGRLAL